MFARLVTYGIASAILPTDKKPIKGCPVVTASRAVSVLTDKRVNCLSVMTTVTVDTYLNLVDDAYFNRGGIEGQREPLRTTSALRIRRRMVEDIEAGAVLPPVVIGIVLPTAQFKRLEIKTQRDVMQLLKQVDADRISIIDGMQRSTAIREAYEALVETEYQVRVEFWISNKINSLLYRMLVLNTGQVPWNLRRQVEVIFSSVTKQIQETVKQITIVNVDDGTRRTKGAVFRASDLIELFLVFGARKEKIDVRKELSDEYTRLDLIEATSEEGFTDRFCDVLALLVELDIAFDTYKPEVAEGRFQKGRDLFSSQPACVGFVTAIALELFGRPGAEFSPDESAARWQKLERACKLMLGRLRRLNKEDIGKFLEFSTLNETIVRTKSGGVGDFEREYFLKAFQVMVDERFKIESMAPCWRAY